MYDHDVFPFFGMPYGLGWLFMILFWVLAIASLAIMPLVSWGKLRAAMEIGSRALRAEAKETLACAYLSFCLLVGLAANARLGWWWADPMAALLMVPWLVHEGLEGFEEEEEEEEEEEA